MYSYCPYCMGPLGEDGTCPACGKRADAYRPQSHHFPPGILLHERYLIGRSLGEGGFGITYLGFDTSLERRVAVKEYFPNCFVKRENSVTLQVTCYTEADEEYYTKGRKQFLKEARTMARLENITECVRVLDFFPENNTAYIVMEFLEGETLKDMTLREGRISPETVFGMIGPVLRAMESMHRAGIIHRDISPDNLMKLRDGKVKLMDFGCAKDITRGNTMTVTLKHGFAPCEQYSGHSQGPWSDVYGLCATVYYCLTGKVPPTSVFRIGRREDPLIPPGKLGVKLTAAEEHALLKGLSVWKEDRWDSAGELYGALYGVTLDGRPWEEKKKEKPAEENFGKTEYVARKGEGEFSASWEEGEENLKREERAAQGKGGNREAVPAREEKAERKENLEQGESLKGEESRKRGENEKREEQAARKESTARGESAVREERAAQEEDATREEREAQEENAARGGGTAREERAARGENAAQEESAVREERAARGGGTARKESANCGEQPPQKKISAKERSEAQNQDGIQKGKPEPEHDMDTDSDPGRRKVSLLRSLSGRRGILAGAGACVLVLSASVMLFSPSALMEDGGRTAVLAEGEERDSKGKGDRYGESSIPQTSGSREEISENDPSGAAEIDESGAASETVASETAPGTAASRTEAPGTEPPETEAPETAAPAAAPETEALTAAPQSKEELAAQAEEALQSGRYSEAAGFYRQMFADGYISQWELSVYLVDAASDAENAWYETNYGNNAAPEIKAAYELYLEAANMGNVRGMSMVAYCYDYGHYVSRDPAAACEWWKKAGDSGDGPACYFVAQYYAEGNGVPKDNQTALSWLDKCFRYGAGYVQEEAEALRSELYQENIDKAFESFS